MSGPVQTDPDPTLVSSLVQRARAGDTEAFDELYRAHVRAVTRIVTDNVAGAEARAEVVQEVFLRAFRKLGTLQDGTRFRAWLFAIARYAAIDHRRARQRHAVESPGLELVRDVPGTDPDLPQVAEQGDTLRMVLECMGTLSRRDRVVLVLVSHLAMGPSEVAAVLGVSPGAAKVALSRARTRLRDAVCVRILERSDACEDLRSAQPFGPSAIVRHSEGCTACRDAVRNEVFGYCSVATLST